MKKMKKKRRVWKAVLLSVLVLILIFGSIYFRFGGLGTGANADAEEFAKYAQGIDMIQIPSGTTLVLGIILGIGMIQALTRMGMFYLTYTFLFAMFVLYCAVTVIVLFTITFIAFNSMQKAPLVERMRATE